jgi:tRNA 2-thiouridine synthesizing protein A
LSHYELDARRLLCPMPVIRTQEKAAELKPGDTLAVICTDPGAIHDIPAWCRVNGHEIINIREQQDELRINVLICDG